MDAEAMNYSGKGDFSLKVDKKTRLPKMLKALILPVCPRRDLNPHDVATNGF